MGNPFALFPVDDLQKVYGFIRQSLEKGMDISYLTHSSSDGLIAKLTEYRSDVEGYVDSGNLKIRQATSLFPTNEVDGDSTSKNSEEPIDYSGSRIALICPETVTACISADPSNFDSNSRISSPQIMRIIRFENAVNKQFSDSIVICSVFSEFVRGLDLLPLLMLARHHTLMIASEGNTIPILGRNLMHAIEKGMDVTIGEGSSNLILKTFAYVYNINESAILKDPALWFDMLKKVIGNRNANRIIDAATKELLNFVLQQSD